MRGGVGRCFLMTRCAGAHISANTRRRAMVKGSFESSRQDEPSDATQDRVARGTGGVGVIGVAPDSSR